jgi:hypothetical protein
VSLRRSHGDTAQSCAMTSSYHQSQSTPATTTPEQRQAVACATAHYCMHILPRKQFIHQHNPRYQQYHRMLRKSSRTPARGDLDLAPRVDLTQTLSSWPLLSANFLTAQSATHDTRYPFDAQFQLMSHVSGCRASCPRASECDLRLWAAG